MGGTLRVRPAYLTLGITGLVLWLGPDFAAKVEYARTKARVEALRDGPADTPLKMASDAGVLLTQQVSPSVVHITSIVEAPFVDGRGRTGTREEIFNGSGSIENFFTRSRASSPINKWCFNNRSDVHHGRRDLLGKQDASVAGHFERRVRGPITQRFHSGFGPRVFDFGSEIRPQPQHQSSDSKREVRRPDAEGATHGQRPPSLVWYAPPACRSATV